MLEHDSVRGCWDVGKDTDNYQLVHDFPCHGIPSFLKTHMICPISLLSLLTFIHNSSVTFSMSHNHIMGYCLLLFKK